MSNLIRIDFEGNEITGLWYKGQPCMLARDIGRALGYADNGKSLSRRLREWGEEFLDGIDIIRPTDAEWSDTAIGGEFRPLASTPIFLTKSGVDLVCMKTSKPVGVRLRRQIADMDLIEYRQDAAGEFRAEVKPAGRVKSGQERYEILLERERRLARKLDLDERRFKLQALKDGVEALGDFLSPEALQTLRIAALEIGTGLEMPLLKPVVEDDWLSPSQIAERLGVSANAVGRAITKLELRGNIAGMARAIMNKATSCDRNVVSYLYSPAAVARIQARLGQSPATTPTKTAAELVRGACRSIGGTEAPMLLAGDNDPDTDQEDDAASETPKAVH